MIGTLLLALVQSPVDPRAQESELPRVAVERAGQRIEQSCVLVFPKAPLPVADGEVAVRIVGDGLEIRCEGELRGALAGVDPDRYRGVGLAATGADLDLSGARVSGFRVGVLAEGANRARLADLDLSDNFRQRLGSTWEREDAGDWLWPHDNDKGEWLERYGAALAVRDSEGVAIEGVRVREGQNGIVLERVTDSKVERCDASFLSGWGLALWRSSGNRVEGNRFDYCIRGYVHGRYNRGQDSAGILLFEQSSENVFRWNSATHGGDGVFGFAGSEALGEPGEPAEGHAGRGCNGNRFERNDLSFAAAHGFELTFSFDNWLMGNWLEGNAICGAWLGYGRTSQITANVFRANGDAGYGSERGGVNAEHAQGLSFVANRFEHNAVGVRLWTDEDAHLADKPWVQANGAGARDNLFSGNEFVGAGPDLELVATGSTLFHEGDPQPRISADEGSSAALSTYPAPAPDVTMILPTSRLELQQAIERRLRGLPVDGEVTVPPLVLARRERMVIGEWGPYDFGRPWLQPLSRSMGEHSWRLLGAGGLDSVRLLHGTVKLERTPDAFGSERLTVRSPGPSHSGSYAVELEYDGGTPVLEGWLCRLDWVTTAFTYTNDPRENEAAWRAEGSRAGTLRTRLPELDFAFGSGGPGRATGFPGDLPPDRFGVLASTQAVLPAGQYLLRTVSDDGIRVKVNGELVIERWDHHGATEDGAIFESAGRNVPTIIDVEYFELDGAAVLEVELGPL